MPRNGNSKMTEPAKERVLAGLRGGCTRNAAAGGAGIHRVTLLRWMDDAAFRIEVEKAEDEAEARMTRVVAEATVTSWQAAAWWMERRKWQDYGRHERVDVALDVKAEVRRLATELGMDEASVIAEAESIVSAAKR